jgi:uncharacterized membrane protein
VEVIGIRARTHADGEFVLEALKTAVEHKRVALDDIAIVTRDEHSEVEIRPKPGRFRHKGIDPDLLHKVGNAIGDGEAVVFAQGADASIEAVAARVREVSGGDMETFVFNLDDEAFLREAGESLELPTGMLVKAPFS